MENKTVVALKNTLSKWLKTPRSHQIGILSEAYPLPAFKLTSQGYITHVNKSALELYGLEKNQLLNKNYFEAAHEHSFSSAIKSLESVHHAKQPFFFVGGTNIKSIAGKKARIIRWSALKQTPQKESDFYLLGIDTTDLVEESYTLKEMNRVLIDNVPNYYIFWKDINSRFLGCNIAFAKAAGLRAPDELIGKTDYDMPWTKEESDAYVADDQHVMKTGVPKLDIEENQTRRDGYLATHSTSKVPVHDKEGNVCGLIGIACDITEKKNKEAQLIRTKEQLEDALKSRTEFVRNIRHDIRTPLTGISEIGRQLSQGMLSQEQIKEFGYDIQTATEELMELLNQIIEMSKSSSNDMEDRTNKFEFKLLLNSIMRIYKLPAVHKKLRLSCDYDENIPKFLLGKNLRLHKILLNLVGNAIKFTEKGFVEISASIDKQEGRDAVLSLKVKDSGPGIPEDMQDAVFEPLVRLNPSYQGTYKGSGMGLSYVKEHIEKMGGEVYVDSTLNKGTTFICIAPMKIPLLDDADLQAATNMYPENLDSRVTLNTKSKVKVTNSHPAGKESVHGAVLLVEDHPLAQKTTKNTLNDFGYSVDIAASGEEALQLAKNKLYDIIYMDIGLPDISGIDVTRKIRADSSSKNKETIIIALTAHADDEVKNQALSAGMHRVFSKPLTPDKVETTRQNMKFKMEPNRLPVFDWQLWLTRTHGNEALANDTFEMLIKELPEDKHLIEEALATNNLKSLASVTHKMKGGLCYCGLPALEQRVLVLHEAAMQDDCKLENLKSLYKAVLDAIEQVEEVYQQRKKSL